MKKLMTGTALALLTAGAVSAQEFNIDVGGFFEGGFGYVDIDDGNDDIGLSRNSEIIIIATLVADNGLTFGARTEIEADGNDNTDENFLFVTGSFGRFELGEADGAADTLKYRALVTGPFTSAQDEVGMLFDYYAGDSSNRLNFGADTSDSLKITYLTPSFSGFQAGVSYIPNADIQNGDGNSSNRNDGDDAWEIGAAYVGEFGGFTLGAGVGYTLFNGAVGGVAAADAPDSALSASVKGGFAGFELGVSYAITEDAGFNGGDVDTLGVGLKYATGPWTFGGDVSFHLDDAVVENRAGVDEAVEQLGVGVGVAYQLAPGVSTGLTGEYLDNDVAGEDEALAVATYLRLDF